MAAAGLCAALDDTHEQMKNAVDIARERQLGIT